MPLEEYRKSALSRGRSAEEGDNSTALSSRQSRWLSSWLFGMLFNMENDFELVGQITGIEVIAVNLSIRELQGLKAQFGGRRWRKLKGFAFVRFPNGEVHKAELHWYEAHGVGRRKMKVKRRLD